jgi:predicted GH43/DUF377 family glycosyl hydrolase
MSGPAPATGTLAKRLPVRVCPDPSRVITKLFVPGEEVPESQSRATVVIERILGLTDAEVSSLLADTMAKFDSRHRDLAETFDRHFAVVGHRLPTTAAVSAQRKLLIGAYFTHEYAVEAAALFNPSLVAHPDQRGVEAGGLRVLMSVRAVGEGHLSSIGFRTGLLGPGSELRLDDPGRFLTTGRAHSAGHDRSLLSGKLAESDHDNEVAHAVLNLLPPQFDTTDLDRAIGAIPDHLQARGNSHETVQHVRWLVASAYELEFAPDTAIRERLLWPSGPAESHGMEDARFVLFRDDDGTPTYYATYTAFDGTRVTPHLLQTNDFTTFHITQMTGPSARNKGMALFPRRIGGRYLALSRWDRESIAVAASDDLQAWGVPHQVAPPTRGWELVQIGNCGSPIETPEGWLVLTHGVGPMRTYAIGAMLLDLDDPRRVTGTLTAPLLTPTDGERDGYVPNVVYSCGALLHRQTLILPYGISDSAIGFAAVSLPGLLDAMLRTGRSESSMAR